MGSEILFRRSRVTGLLVAVGVLNPPGVCKPSVLYAVKILDGTKRNTKLFQGNPRK